MSDQVGNPEDRFSQNEAQIRTNVSTTFKCNIPYERMHVYIQCPGVYGIPERGTTEDGFSSHFFVFLKLLFLALLLLYVT